MQLLKKAILLVNEQIEFARWNICIEKQKQFIVSSLKKKLQLNYNGQERRLNWLNWFTRFAEPEV